jgi:hypothetical protein
MDAYQKRSTINQKINICPQKAELVDKIKNISLFYQKSLNIFRKNLIHIYGIQ